MYRRNQTLYLLPHRHWRVIFFVMPVFAFKIRKPRLFVQDRGNPPILLGEL